MHKNSRSIHVSISNLGKLIKATCDIIASRLSSKKLHLSVPSAENTLQITIHFLAIRPKVLRGHLLKTNPV